VKKEEKKEEKKERAGTQEAKKSELDDNTAKGDDLELELDLHLDGLNLDPSDPSGASSSSTNHKDEDGLDDLWNIDSELPGAKNNTQQ